MKPWHGKALLHLGLWGMLGAAVYLKVSGNALAETPVFHVWAYPVTWFALLFWIPFTVLGQIYTNLLKKALELAASSGFLRWAALGVAVFGVLGVISFLAGVDLIGGLRELFWPAEVSP